VILLAPLGAWADGFYSGNDIQKNCVDTGSGELMANVTKYNSCVMYLSGLLDAAKTLDGWGGRDKEGRLWGSCTPKSVSQEQIRQVWLKFAKEHPEELHLIAASIALDAFEEAWPCKRAAP